jgi:hypothetical protein
MKKGMGWIDLSFFKGVSSVTLFGEKTWFHIDYIETTGFDTPIRKGGAV